MKNCVFCKIVKGEIESEKIWEDREFLAILDINPNTKGMTLVLTKKHYSLHAFDIPKNVYEKFILATRKVAKILEKGLKVARVTIVAAGMGINHAHIKLYPLHGVKKKFEEMWGKDRVFFTKYEGFISTQLGPRVDFQELKRLAEQIKKRA